MCKLTVSMVFRFPELGQPFIFNFNRYSDQATVSPQSVSGAMYKIQCTCVTERPIPYDYSCVKILITFSGPLPLE